MPPGTRNGKTGQPWRGIDPKAKGLHWRYTPEKLDELDRQGYIYWAEGGNGLPRLKRYLDKDQGVALQDLWVDISPINSRAQERLGYPTQKPEALLERLIYASSNEGDVVLDPLCGCGTTVAVAQRLRRKWVGIDISPTAVRLMAARLRKLQPRAQFQTQGLPVSVDDLKRLKPFEFQNWVIQTFVGTHSSRNSGDMGIDGYSFLVNDPIQVKQSERVGRNVVDNFETAVRRASKDTGYIVAFSFTRSAHEEAARARRQDRINIRLITVAQLLTPQAAYIVQGLAPVTELPIPSSRGPAARPSVEELIMSDRESTG